MRVKRPSRDQNGPIVAQIQSLCLHAGGLAFGPTKTNNGSKRGMSAFESARSTPPPVDRRRFSAVHTVLRTVAVSTLAVAMLAIAAEEYGRQANRNAPARTQPVVQAATERAVQPHAAPRAEAVAAVSSHSDTSVQHASARGNDTANAARGAEECPEPVGCPDEMVKVQGEYCPSVLHRCVRWINQKGDRCAEYERTSRCFGKPVPKRFCIDRFEYPNQLGASPEVGMTWEDAKAKCASLGKRLCTSSEWTLACEGPHRYPYPAGFDRGACNYDRPYIMPNDAAFRNPATRPQEIQRLSQSEPSGTRGECVSHYGAYDMTGNVDEWVVNEQGSPVDRPYESGLKGGYWGPVRNRCRPMTVDHNAWHAGYQIGFRCCADLPESPALPEGESAPDRPGHC
jgi:sulfatase modifying factor 1